MVLTLHQAMGRRQRPFGQAQAFAALVQQAPPSFQRLTERRLQGLEAFEGFHSTVNRRIRQPASRA
ncbi:hypothetical protein [Azospirillum melinis]